MVVRLLEILLLVQISTRFVTLVVLPMSQSVAPHTVPPVESDVNHSGRNIDRHIVFVQWHGGTAVF